MPRKATTMSLCLAEEARSRLSALARSRTAPAHHVKRSAIILQLADRHDATEIAVTLGIDRPAAHALRPARDGRGTAQGDRESATLGTAAGDHGSDADLADRRGLCQTEGPRLSARTLDASSTGGSRARPRTRRRSCLPGGVRTEHGARDPAQATDQAPQGALLHRTPRPEL
jgi:hypothetical protein